MPNLKPCKLTYKGTRYTINSSGLVLIDSGGMMPARVPDYLAAEVKAEATRIRRNRTNRARSQAMKDLGMVRTRGGGWE
jgi:hypothetical protein